MLISRVAGLGTLQHKPIGFTGPLSQHLLGYGSIVNTVRQTLRDLIEVTATQMYLTGCVDRSVELPGLTSKYDQFLRQAGTLLTSAQATIPSPQQLRTQHWGQVIPRRTHKRPRPNINGNQVPSCRDCFHPLLPPVHSLRARPPGSFCFVGRSLCRRQGVRK